MRYRNRAGSAWPSRRRRHRAACGRRWSRHGELLAAMQPLGPGGLFLLRRRQAGACLRRHRWDPDASGQRRRRSSQRGREPPRLPGSGSHASCGGPPDLRAGLGDVAQARHRALLRRRRGGGTGPNADFALLAAEWRRTRYRPAWRRPGPCARQQPRRHPRPSRRPMATRAGRADRQHRPSRPRRAAAHRTPGPWRCRGRRSQRQQGERGQHDDQRVVDGRLGGMDLELREQARADADDDGQHQTLMPDGHHVAQHLFRQNAVLFQSANGTSTKPASVVSLNSISVMKSWIASTKKQQRPQPARRKHHHDGVEVHEHLGKARHLADLLQNRRPGVDAGFRQPARLQEVLHRDGRAGGGDAQIPANERNTMLASQLKLPMMM